MIYFILYNLLLIAAYPLIIAFFGVSAISNVKFTGTVRERLGFYKTKPRGAGNVWLHAVSVGEAVGATPLIRLLLEREKKKRIVVTTTTKGGMEALKKTFGDSVTVAYFPFDFPWVIRRAFKAFRPSALILMETEIWPNLINACRSRGLPVLLLNGRVSDRMAGAKGFVRGLYGWTFSRMDALGMQTGRDVDRIRELGAARDAVHLMGNMKFDGVMTRLDGEKIEELRCTVAPGKDLIFVAGSTHPGEEEITLDALRSLRRAHKTLRMIIAPRHVERSPEVVELCRAAGWRVDLRSAHGPNNPCGGDVVVWDTIGELRCLYSLATVCFVGGSLIERGGHNILEPAACGKAAFYGPHLANFMASAQALESGGGGRRVSDGAGLIEAVGQYLDDESERKRMDAAALEVVKRNAGASERAYELYRRIAGEKRG